MSWGAARGVKADMVRRGIRVRSGTRFARREFTFFNLFSI